MFDNMTYEEIRQRILDNINLDIDKREGSFLSNTVSPLSVELAKTYLDMQDILSLGFIQTNFDDFLDRRVNEFGVYRKQGKKATGEITVTGNEGAIIEDGTLIKANNIYFVALNRLEISLDNILYVEAIEEGYKGNILANTIFELVEVNNSITSLTNKSNFTGGLDIETDEELRKRFVKVVNNPSTSGNKAHYEEWALQVSGVGSARVYPLWAGNGTVKVMIIGNDNKPVLEDVINECKAYIEANVPIGCTLTVTTPSNLDIAIVSIIELEEGYEKLDIKTEFEARLNEYLKNVDNELVYSKVYGILATIGGVNDITSLTLNGATENILIDESKIINISSIQINEVI